MIEIEKPRIECIENSAEASYGKFIVEPLERGYGTTLGNSLRRVLLSSLPGTAVTKIKIAGVQHEFSTIPGVTEDVTEIVLNVKGIIARLHCDTPKTVYIEASGEGDVTAGDIKTDAEVEILNPELHIATVGEGGSLNMQLTLSHGRGYVPADRNKPAQTIIGLIPVDSIYTPVYKVNYTVEPTRVGASSDFDKLTLEVWTDSTITAHITVANGSNDPVTCDAVGNGRLDAVSNAVKAYLNMDFALTTYTEHALAVRSNSKAVSYVGLEKNGKTCWGVGIRSDIINSSISAFLSALNQLITDCK